MARTGALVRTLLIINAVVGMEPGSLVFYHLFRPDSVWQFYDIVIFRKPTRCNLSNGARMCGGDAGLGRLFLMFTTCTALLHGTGAGRHIVPFYTF